MDASGNLALPDLPASWPKLDLTLRDGLVACRDAKRLKKLFARLPPADVLAILKTWECLARRDQLPPARAQGGAPWGVWLNIGGRGAGKTRTGAEWVRGVALGIPGFSHPPLGASPWWGRQQRMCAR